MKDLAQYEGWLVSNLFNELFFLQILLFLTLIYFVSSLNIITVWYLAGIYLVLLGWWLLLDDGDIFVGFLWVIDLGVGLVFFIFILHYSTFLHQKPTCNKAMTSFIYWPFAVLSAVSLLSFLAPDRTGALGLVFSKIWFFMLSWYDYYEFMFSSTVTDLNLLHEIYFSNNSFEFFLINFFLLYGIIGAVLLSFLVKRVFALLNYSELTSSLFFTRTNSTYFVRSQDYLKQQRSSSSARIWTKEKNSTL